MFPLAAAVTLQTTNHQRDHKVHALCLPCGCRLLWETATSCWTPTTRPAICRMENTARRAWDRLDLTPKTKSLCQSVAKTLVHFIQTNHWFNYAQFCTSKIMTLPERGAFVNVCWWAEKNTRSVFHFTAKQWLTLDCPHTACWFLFKHSCSQILSKEMGLNRQNEPWNACWFSFCVPFCPFFPP